MTFDERLQEKERKMEWKIVLGKVKRIGNLNDMSIGVLLSFDKDEDPEVDDYILAMNCFSSEYLENYDINDIVWCITNSYKSRGYVLCKAAPLVEYSKTDDKIANSTEQVESNIIYDKTAIEIFQLYTQKTMPGLNTDIGMLKMLYCDNNIFVMLDKMTLKYIIFYPSRPNCLFYMSPDKVALQAGKSNIILSNNFIDITSPNVNINSDNINLGNNAHDYVCVLPKNSKGIDPQISENVKA